MVSYYGFEIWHHVLFFNLSQQWKYILRIKRCKVYLSMCYFKCQAQKIINTRVWGLNFIIFGGGGGSLGRRGRVKPSGALLLLSLQDALVHPRVTPRIWPCPHLYTCVKRQCGNSVIYATTRQAPEALRRALHHHLLLHDFLSIYLYISFWKEPKVLNQKMLDISSFVFFYLASF